MPRNALQVPGHPLRHRGLPWREGRVGQGRPSQPLAHHAGGWRTHQRPPDHCRPTAPLPARRQTEGRGWRFEHCRSLTHRSERVVQPARVRRRSRLKMYMDRGILDVGDPAATKAQGRTGRRGPNISSASRYVRCHLERMVGSMTASRCADRRRDGALGELLSVHQRSN